MEIFADIAVNERQRARLGEIAGAAALHFAPQAGEAEFRRCAVCFGNPPPAWLGGSEALRWLQLESVGFGEYAALDWTRLAGRLTVTNLAGFFSQPVAESILAGILALYRGLDELLRLQARGEWQGEALRPGLRTLEGATVVMFGYGAINRRLGELLAPFGCRIRPFGSCWQAGDLDAALAGADIVVCTAPDTPATRGVFDAARLARLPAHALFASFGRGSVVDEAALAAALSGGALGGAVLDVTVTEPLPPDHAFWRAPNTLVTQHTAGGSGAETDRKIEVFAANLERFRRGETLAGVVDFARGY